MRTSGSMYAVGPQPMTRTSTAQESDQLLTPRDAFGYAQATSIYDGKELYRHDTYQPSEDDNSVYTPDSRHQSPRKGPGYMHQTTRAEFEQDRPYSSLPDPPTEQIPLSRKKTTKELINRYELMESSCASSRRSSVTVTNKATPTRLESPAHQKPRKSKSPLRQSFRNLLSVFGKKSKTPTAEEATLASIPSRSLARQISPIDIARANSSAHEISTNTIICNTPNSLHSGALLYLCRSSVPGSFPIWTNCTAILHPSHILVTSHSSQGNPSTSMITLAHCTDVRSLALGDLEEVERSLLPSDASTTELKTFELLFEGRAREKFAANSVRERATWVNAIWDAILQAQESKSYLSSPTKEDDLFLTGELSSLALTRVEARVPSKPKSVTSTTSGRRDLPALPALPALPVLPAPASPVRVTLYDAPVSRTNSPRSSLQTSTPTRTQSPSIRNLGQRSVVKQRLAQLERTYSQESSQSGLTTPSSMNSYRRSHSPLTPTSSQPPTLSRRRTTQSAAGDSIIDCYGDVGRRSSTLKAPSVPKPYGRTRSPATSRLPPREDLFSPASKYSTDEVVTQPFKMPSQLHSITGLPMQESRPPLLYNRASPLNVQETSKESKPLPTPDIEDRLANIQSGIALLASGRTEPSAPQPDKQTEKILRNIQNAVKGIEGQGAMSGQDLMVVRNQVGTVLSELRAHVAGKEDQRIEGVVHKLDDLQTTLSSQLPELLEKLTTLKLAAEESRGGSTTMQNIGRGGSSNDAPAMDLGPIEGKLGELLTLYQTLQTGGPASGGQEPDDESKNKMQEILELLKSEQAERVTQSEQQTDSVRYLNELNTWLEAFVNHGTSQIDHVVAGVQQLCKELGPVTELQDAAPGEDGQIPGEHQEHSSSLLSDIRRFLIKNQDREESTAILQASVNGLVAAVQEDLRRNSEARNQLTTESIVGMIERQRQDQERMLRALQSELANEIRGQRLRFVEAMKEATAINVQIHVEEFKKELTREVLLMTQEVGRLQRERQTLEQQIADLFAFYAKQKQSAGEPIAPSAPSVRAPRPRQGVPRALPTMRRRPLPTPSPGPSMRG